MSDRRPVEQVRAEAHVVKRDRVLRWLTRLLSESAVRLSNVSVADANNVETWKLRGRVQLLVELVDNFANGRER